MWCLAGRLAVLVLVARLALDVATPSLPGAFVIADGGIEAQGELAAVALARTPEHVWLPARPLPFVIAHLERASASPRPALVRTTRNYPRPLRQPGNHDPGAALSDSTDH